MILRRIYTYILTIITLGSLLVALHVNVYADTFSSTHVHRKQYTIYAGGWSGIIRNFNFILTTEAFKYTREKYGNYKIHIEDREISTDRKLLLLNQGKYLHMDIIAGNTQKLIKHKNVIHKRYNIYKGILGLRQIIVNQDDRAQMNLQNFSFFKTQKVGQGHDWSDLAVYQNANIPTVTGQSVVSLLHMLRERRFDHFPLSILEAKAAIKNNPGFTKSLSTIDNVFIFYPTPVYFIFNKHDDTFERFEYGLKKMMEDNKYEKIYLKYFHKYISQVTRPGVTINILSNPLLSREENHLLISDFFKDFTNNKSKVNYFGDIADISCSENTTFASCIKSRP